MLGFALLAHHDRDGLLTTRHLGAALGTAVECPVLELRHDLVVRHNTYSTIDNVSSASADPEKISRPMSRLGRPIGSSVRTSRHQSSRVGMIHCFRSPPSTTRPSCRTFHLSVLSTTVGLDVSRHAIDGALSHGQRRTWRLLNVDLECHLGHRLRWPVLLVELLEDGPLGSFQRYCRLLLHARLQNRLAIQCLT